MSGVPGLAGATAFDFHRLFGDADGDADVDALDLFQFRRAFGSTAGQTAYRLAFDFDGDGRIDNADLTALRLRLGRRLP